ncbi:MAG: gluconolaconase [Acidobacteria bacterium]|nr:gluconolaconase [Acidobacteriota bacterium]
MAEPHYMAQGLRFPEGPVAMPDGSVVLVEIARGTVTRIADDGIVSVVSAVGGGPNGAAIGPDGACYICNAGGSRWQETDQGIRPVGQADDYTTGRIERVDLATGEMTRLYDKAENGALNAPNDIVFDRTGGFWFTDTGSGRHRSMDRGGIFYARPDGSSITEVIFPMLQPNGIGLSPGEDVLYVAETVSGRLWAFDIETPGRINRLTWPSPNGGRLVTSLPGYRLFDSLAVDAEGNIAVATLYDGGVTVISPAGEILEDIRLPDRFVTNICFGGEDRRTAFITMAETGRLARMPWSRAGLKLNFS